MSKLSRESARSNVDKKNSRYWHGQRQIKKAQKARKERGSPVEGGGFKPEYIPSYKAQRMKERYKDRLKGPKR